MQGLISGRSFDETLTPESSAIFDGNAIDNARSERYKATLEGLEFSSADVYLVTSPLASTKPLSWYDRFPSGTFIFQILTGINTSHRGLHIRSMYFDLKRDGGISNFEAALEGLRSEKKPVSTILLGQTHFTEKELEVMGKST